VGCVSTFRIGVNVHYDDVVVRSILLSSRTSGGDPIHESSLWMWHGPYMQYLLQWFLRSKYMHASCAESASEKECRRAQIQTSRKN
jgi:hypothetical protein